MFDLKMNACQESFLSELEMLDLVDRMDAMKRQEETTYTCRDYLLRRNLRLTADDPAAPRSSDPANRSDPSTFTARCRRKMCEWSYHVVDHYSAPREIVSLAFSILDRFLDRCDCDRTVFKLAAMTSLYVASKAYSHVHLSLRTLASLSRGEFDEGHFRKMEKIILEMIEWRVNPPTAKAFVDHLVNLIPAPGLEADAARRTICARAHFFAELSLLDYYFVPEDVSAVALASVINAMEGLHPPSLVRRMRESFLRDAELHAGMDYAYQKVSYDMMQERLWKLYRETEEYRIHDAVPKATGNRGLPSERAIKRKTATPASPVSVALEHVDLNGTFSF